MLRVVQSQDDIEIRKKEEERFSSEKRGQPVNPK